MQNTLCEIKKVFEMPSMEPFVHGLGEWLFTTDGTRFDPGVRPQLKLGRA